MIFRWFLVLLLGTIIAASVSSPAQAAEPYLEFVEGLRQREYFDIAIAYLEQLEKQTDVPSDVRTVLPFEKAQTLLKWAQTLRSAEAQMKQLDQAETLLKSFLSANPTHAEAGTANTLLAVIIVEKGKSVLLQSKSPGNAAQKAELQKRARQYFGEARKVYQTAYDRYKEQHKKFDSFIPPTDKRFAAREEVYEKMVYSQLQLAVMTYQEGQTYDRGTAENKQRLTDAAGEFDKIHSEFRQLVSGLYARMWEAKCWEEQDEIGKALGFYTELLGHAKDLPASQVAPALRKLQNTVLHFKLICLNHDKKKDYQIAVMEAEAWLKENRNLASSRDGLGIRWEMVRALELQAKQESTTEVEKNTLLQKALENARQISRFPGEYKDGSTVMIQRLMVALKRETGDPKDFATAFGIADNMRNEVRNRLKKINEARGAEQYRQLMELQPILKEAVRILQLGLGLVGPKDEAKEINRARYYLSYFLFLIRDEVDGKLQPSYSFDSAVVADYVARQELAKRPDEALEAAFLAQAAYNQAYAAAPPHARDAEIKLFVSASNFIIENWAGSDRADDARMDIGRVYTENRQPAEGAKWFLQVPETSKKYLEAQLAAGNAWWWAYQSESIRPEGERKPKEELDAMVVNSRQILKAAIAKVESNLSGDISTVDQEKLRSLTTAKASYAAILNGSGDFKEALDPLTVGPYSVLNAIAPPNNNEAERPEEGLKNRKYASWVYGQVLLRAYIGIQDLDNARSAMRKLEAAVGAGGGGAEITKVYKDLGQELEKEVNRLNSAKDPRLNDVLKSFENFLGDMSNRKEGHDFNTLNWIASTYTNLADGVASGDSAKAQVYFGKAAAAIQMLLDLDAAKPGLIPEQAVLGVKLRLVTFKRSERSFDAAHKLLLEILKEKAKAIDVQIEAAQLFQDWATYGGEEHFSKFEIAIHGGKKKTEDAKVWGWGGLADKLQTNLQANPKPEYEKQFLDVSYNVANCLFAYMNAATKDKQRRELIRETLTAVKRPRAMLPQLGGGDSWARYNVLYRKTQQVMLDMGLDEMKGKQIVDLERTLTKEEREAEKAAKEARNGAEHESSGESTAKKSKPKKAAESKGAKKPESSGTTTVIILVVVVLLGGGGAAYWIFAQGKKKPARRRSVVAEEVDDPFAGASAPSAPAAKPRSKPKPP